MNNKGEIRVGTIMVVFISIIVGVILFQVVAQQAGDVTNTVSIANLSLGDIDNSTVYLTDYKHITSVVVFNESGDAIVPGTEYTVTNNVVYNGALAVQVVPATAPDGDYYGFEWTISGTAQPLTYASDSGSRAVVALIVIFFALAIVAVALYPVYGSKLMEMFGK